MKKYHLVFQYVDSDINNWVSGRIYTMYEIEKYFTTEIQQKAIVCLISVKSIKYKPC